MKHKKSIKEAQNSLYKKLFGEPWFLFIGIDTDKLFIYTTKHKVIDVPSKWYGYSVEIRKLGEIKTI